MYDSGMKMTLTITRARIPAPRHPDALALMLAFTFAVAAALFNQPAVGQERDHQGRGFLIEPQDLTDREIEWAVEAIKDGLYQRQNEKGTWERRYPQGALSHLNSHQGGQTSLAVFALISAGESYQEKSLQPALDFLLSHKSDYTYVRSLRAHLWAGLPRRFAKALDRERQWLIRHYDFNSGSWNYTASPMRSGYDNSLTQYGVLGLWEAAKRGLDVPDRLWKRVEEHYLRTQLTDGGWNYRPQWSGARGSMTAAGLTCLFVTQDFLHAAEDLDISRKESDREKAINNGLQWLDEHFSVEVHPGGPGNRQQYYYYYYLYGIERVGLASGYRRFAGQDWFRAGAAAIITRMCEPVRDDESGAIIGFEARDEFAKTGNTEVAVVQLSFALMFLAHGRMPIIISKLRDDDLGWNNRPRDAANLTRWISDEVEEQRHWQILDIDRPMEEWFDGPLVYLATHDPLPYVEAHRRALDRRRDERGPAPAPTRLERLKRYLELGGLLVTNADAHRDRMTESVRELALEMFPDFEWRMLPEDHWAYTLSAPVIERPRLYGLTNGVRELMIHFEHIDAGAVLQANERKRYEDTFATLSNIYYYASERGRTRPRLARKLPSGLRAPGIPPGSASKSSDPRNEPLVIWRGVYEGNWNPEPAADELLRLRLRNEYDMNPRFRDVRLADLAEHEPDAMRGTLLWARGTEAHRFTDDEEEALRRFIAAGGVPLFETVGGVGAFGRSIEEAFEEVYPEARFRRCIRHPIITGKGLPDGADCSRVTYRLYSLDRFGTRATRVRLRSMNPRNEIDRPNVFVSREDLSHALLGQPCWGVSGYVTDDAVKVLANLIRFADSQRE